MKFTAKEIFADYDENEILIIGFLGEATEQDDQIYFMIQDSNEYDHQDKELGMDTYYIEKNDQSMSGYGGVKELRLSKNKIQIDLDQKGIERLEETNIEIDFECNFDEFKNLHERLNQIFSSGELKTTYNKV
jgi:hypothetical protein